MKCGLLYLSQESCLIGDVSYHNYEGLVVEKAEWESLSRDLGVHNKVMLLRNHGKSWFKINFNKYPGKIGFISDCIMHSRQNFPHELG